MVVVCALITVAKGKGNEYQEKFKGLAAKVRKDPGTITYVLNRSMEDPDKFFVFEQYENEEALKYHASTEHFQAYRKETADLVKDRDVSFYQEVV